MKIPKNVLELLPEVFAKKCEELPFKYKGEKIFEPVYDKMIIADFPRYILLDEEGNAELAEDDECIEIQDMSSSPRNKISSAGYDSSELSDEWAEELSKDI